MLVDPTQPTPRSPRPLDPEPTRGDHRDREVVGEGPVSVLCGDRPMLFGPGVDDFNELDDPC